MFYLVFPTSCGVLKTVSSQQSLKGQFVSTNRALQWLTVILTRNLQRALQRTTPCRALKLGSVPQHHRYPMQAITDLRFAQYLVDGL